MKDEETEGRYFDRFDGCDFEEEQMRMVGVG